MKNFMFALVVLFVLAGCGSDYLAPCGQGTIYRGRECIPEFPVVQCGNGQHVVDGFCTNIALPKECGEREIQVLVADPVRGSYIECRIDPSQVHERVCMPGTIASGEGCIPDPTNQVQCASDTRRVGNLCVGANQPTPSVIRTWMTTRGSPSSLDTPAWSYKVGEIGILAGDEPVTVDGVLPVYVEANIWWYGTTEPTDIQTATLVDQSGHIIASSGGPNANGVINFNITTPYRIEPHSIGRFEIQMNLPSVEMTGIRYRFIVWPESISAKSTVTGVQAAVDSTAPMYSDDYTLYHARPQFAVASDTPVGTPSLVSGDYMQVGRFTAWNGSSSYNLGISEILVVIKRSRAWSSSIRVAIDTTTDRFETIVTPYQERIGDTNFYVVPLAHNQQISLNVGQTERVNVLIGREGSLPGDRVEAAIYTRGTRWWENSGNYGNSHDWLDAGPWLGFPSLTVH